MPMFYFHIKDGATTLDEVGSEHSSLAGAQKEAVQLCRELVTRSSIWTGEPWQLWVTDQPSAGGATIFTLQVSAKMAA
jgi:hypothetical protein